MPIYGLLEYEEWWNTSCRLGNGEAEKRQLGNVGQTLIAVNKRKPLASRQGGLRPKNKRQCFQWKPVKPSFGSFLKAIKLIFYHGNREEKSQVSHGTVYCNTQNLWLPKQNLES